MEVIIPYSRMSTFIIH